MSIKRRLEKLEYRMPPGNPNVINLADLFRRLDEVRAGAKPDPEVAEILANVAEQRRFGANLNDHHADGAGNGA